MSARFLTACLLAVCVGCGKQSSSAPAPAEPKSSAATPTTKPTTPVPQAVPSAEATATDAVQIAAVLSELTQAVRKYSVEQRSVPKSLEELVAKGYLSRVPPAPNGKKFAINKNLQVYLADR